MRLVVSAVTSFWLFPGFSVPVYAAFPLGCFSFSDKCVKLTYIFRFFTYVANVSAHCDTDGHASLGDESGGPFVCGSCLPCQALRDLLHRVCGRWLLCSAHSFMCVVGPSVREPLQVCFDAGPERRIYFFFLLFFP